MGNANVVTGLANDGRVVGHPVAVRRAAIVRQSGAQGRGGGVADKLRALDLEAGRAAVAGGVGSGEVKTVAAKRQGQVGEAEGTGFVCRGAQAKGGELDGGASSGLPNQRDDLGGGAQIPEGAAIGCRIKRELPQGRCAGVEGEADSFFGRVAGCVERLDQDTVFTIGEDATRQAGQLPCAERETAVGLD
ncbi:MAG: hypothetical protein AW10_00146 [Candidatus Accumulibacter appositus]|uniref:Uncharacterized protein n=1 Tax=Candidatus Accumulibacter appositus TaxID=1454003 RepID=A0A011Q137_9PROT|nr:MAG: hypothetical protein AW10_00146 [Candidatus Accumulibacter appositus]